MAAQPRSAFTLITGGSGIGLELARQAAGDRRDLILAAQIARGQETLFLVAMVSLPASAGRARFGS